MPYKPQFVDSSDKATFPLTGKPFPLASDAPTTRFAAGETEIHLGEVVAAVRARGANPAKRHEGKVRFAFAAYGSRRREAPGEGA